MLVHCWCYWEMRRLLLSIYYQRMQETWVWVKVMCFKTRRRITRLKTITGCLTSGRGRKSLFYRGLLNQLIYFLIKKRAALTLVVGAQCQDYCDSAHVPNLAVQFWSGCLDFSQYPILGHESTFEFHLSCQMSLSLLTDTVLV